MSRAAVCVDTEAICPYCAAALPKMPQAKKKCPSCAKPIYVRSRPLDGKRVLLREDQRELMDEQKAIAYGTHEEFLSEKSKRDGLAQALQVRLGRPADKAELDWALLEDEMTESARQLNWGVYRCARMDMGLMLRDRGNLEAALTTLLEVCYIDLNGPRNCVGHGSMLPDEDVPFAPDDAFLVPGVVTNTAELALELRGSPERAHADFDEMAQRVRAQLRLPVTPEEAWAKLLPELTESVEGLE